MQNRSFDIHDGMLQKEYASLEAEAQAIAKRFWWLVGAALVGLAGCIRLLTGGETAHEFRRSFGEFGENAVMWALLIGGVWLVVDFTRGRTIKARSHAVYLELQARGFAYDFGQRCWSVASTDSAR